MKKYSVWSDEEVKNLFSLVEDYRKRNLSLLSAFDAYAKKTGRKQNSVRNYYYFELSEISKDTDRRKKFNVDLSLHKVINPKTFSNNEVEKIITEIIRLTSLGFSVRKACLKLSNNNISEMVRLQNKYRNILQNNPELINKCSNKLKEKGIVTTNPIKKEKKDYGDNIISMPLRAKNKLTDSEITSLFLGLVKLVKKCAKEEAEEKLKDEAEFANNTLRKTIVRLSSAEIENKKLTDSYKLILREKEEKDIEIKHLKSEVASLMKDKMENISTEKLENLEQYIKTMKKQKKAKDS